MLKLERVPHNTQVNVAVRDKKHLFTGTFLKALSLAAGLHLLIFVLFHVSPIKIRWNNTSFTPIMVESDLTLPNDGLVIASANLNPKPRTSLLEPKPSLPILRDAPAYQAAGQMEFISEKNLLNNPFTGIEKEIYQPAFSPAQQSSPTQPLTVVIAGNLASKQLLGSGISQQIASSLPGLLKQRESTRAIYSVLVDGRTGRIIWIEQLQKTNHGKLERISETILENLQFAPDEKSFVTAGEIELHFKGKRHD